MEIKPEVPDGLEEDLNEAYVRIRYEDGDECKEIEVGPEFRARRRRACIEIRPVVVIVQDDSEQSSEIVAIPLARIQTIDVDRVEFMPPDFSDHDKPPNKEKRPISHWVKNGGSLERWGPPLRTSEK